jgi:hypothetical protein
MAGTVRPAAATASISFRIHQSPTNQLAALCERQAGSASVG